MASIVAHSSMTESQQTREGAINALKENLPDWFGGVFSFILSDLNNICETTREVNICKTLCNDHEIKIQSLESKVTDLITTSKEQGNAITELREENLRLQTFSRRNNLLCDGVTENPMENLGNIITSLFEETFEIPKKHVQGIQFVAHRVGKAPHLRPESVKRPRPILIKFAEHSDRMSVWAAKKKLKGTKISLNEDFPRAINERRAALFPYFMAARKHPSVKKCFLTYDRLIVNERSYTKDKVGELPYNLVYAGVSMRELPRINAVAFFGIDSFMSNFHPCVIKENNEIFSSSEMMYQFKKAEFFGDDNIARQILSSKTPKQAKAISYKIKGYNETRWRRVARSTMEKCVMLKFTQNEDLKELLLQIEESIVEANPGDQYFSCGLGLTHPDLDNSSKWSGENVLGKIIETVRANISSGSHELKNNSDGEE